MNINRNNYEEYFILYMDNELCIDDQRQVEEFIQKHPDLKEELDILLQYKLTPDTSIVFKGKEDLMMNGGNSSININNYQEWLILYIDNELSTEQKIKVEQFITSNPVLKKELEALQQTKLQPEEIIFDNKDSLYRREERIISIRWWRIAAAAVLLLAFGISAIGLLNKKSISKIEVAKNANKKQERKKENTAGNDSEEQKEIINPIVANNQPVIITNKKQKANDVVVRKINNVIKNLSAKESFKSNSEEQAVVQSNEKPSNNLPQPNRNIITNDPNIGIADVNAKQNNKPGSLTNQNVTPVAIQTSYTSNTDNDLNQSGGKKSKLRGFLRKLTRTFEKNTNIDPTDDDDKVLIGGLALKLK